jgi:hypothetical protein
MREKYLSAFRSYCTGMIERHIANVENIISNGVGVAEHPDMIGTLEGEVANIAKYDEMLQMVDKHL